MDEKGPTPRHVARCGTYSGYRRHKADGETSCDACFRAMREYGARQKNTPVNQRKARLRSIAQSYAQSDIRAMYPVEWRKSYDGHLAELFEEAGFDPPNREGKP